ncbi:protein-export membrane protein SecF [Methylocaldum marinum]|uniref:Protein-export membrane protein SecF n=1 Tax=Methylocaldum marinum TaxID=1432792 RepID=A0A250KPY0_9GAMM|nr:protein translocase subunit SecF [Methylocaldum marinum]BBA33733.1 protein-export membrane protein SecF [Methylocaldum marinum]
MTDTNSRGYKIDFMRWSWPAVILSAVLSVVSIVSLGWQGLNFAIDFTGGTIIEVAYQEPADLEEVRQQLRDAGFANPIVQHFGTTREVLIRLAPQAELTSTDLRARIMDALGKNPQVQAELHRVEFVGPQVGEDLAESAVVALLLAILGILAYVAWRFEYRFSFGAILASAHDIVLILGVFSVFQLDFDLSVLAAVLAILGYSINDTIVIFDRIRENFRKIRRGEVLDIINLSINETLSRTLMTSFLTLLACTSMAIWGGEVLRNFALALIVGIVVGTYSSIYVASALAYRLGISRADLLLPEKEGATDNRP